MGTEQTTNTHLFLFNKIETQITHIHHQSPPSVTALVWLKILTKSSTHYEQKAGLTDSRILSLHSKLIKAVSFKISILTQKVSFIWRVWQEESCTRLVGDQISHVFCPLCLGASLHHLGPGMAFVALKKVRRDIEETEFEHFLRREVTVGFCCGLGCGLTERFSLHFEYIFRRYVNSREHEPMRDG